ncbi:MAG: sulfite exporter TauE/SafE family protein [Acidobacteria bacterium]|nr:sulfite exporter TauE/SafE family protein [Acidobacteriota bacterium]
MADLSYPLTAAAAFLGGAVNAVAGGGTLLTFPSLLALISPVAANATSTVALFPGSLASAWGYRTEVAASREPLKYLFPPSLIGGVLGSLAVIRFPDRVFENLVPWLLLLASCLLLAQKPVARWIGAQPHDTPSRSTIAIIVFFQFLVGIYGGYFGAGIGILMLSSLGFMGIPDIHQMNAVKAILAAAMNGVAIGVFVLDGRVNWKFAVPMALASIAGGYLAARVARKMKPGTIRTIVICIGFSVAAYSFYRRFGA